MLVIIVNIHFFAFVTSTVLFFVQIAYSGNERMVSRCVCFSIRQVACFIL